MGSVNIDHDKEGIKVIKTKYYSDVTKKFYDVHDEAIEEEEKEKEKNALELKKKEEKAQRAKEIEAAYQKYVDDYKQFLELKNKFVKDYGSFHMTFKDNTPKVVETNLFDLFDWFI